MNSKKGGFTLIELLVVIAIIGFLSSIVMSSMQSARGKSRDARRIQDLNQARTALVLYHGNYDNWMQGGSGCGSSGGGNGYFSYPYSGATAMSQCLVNAGLTPAEIIDPTRGRGGTTSSNNLYAYMKYSCSAGTYLYAKLQERPQSTTVADGTCCPACDTSYGMNYVLRVQ